MKFNGTNWVNETKPKMKTLKSLFIKSIITLLGVYGAFFSQVENIDLFTIYAVLCFFLNICVLLACASEDFINEVLKDSKKSILRRIGNTAYILIWFVIWGQIVLNGHFWTGFFGIMSNMVAFFILAILREKLKNKMSEENE